MFSPDAIQRILFETFVERVDFHDEIPSTNSRALELARQAGELTGATLVLASRQTSGRGRNGNSWWSTHGSLTCSLLMDCQRLGLPSGSLPRISLIAGLAVCDAIQRLLPDQRPALKWPNDVYLAGRKVCGMLAESTDSRMGVVVLGIGVNVNNSMVGCPAELRDTAIALCDLVGSDVSILELLIGILQQLRPGIQLLAEASDDLRELWQPRCLLTGRQVSVDLGPRTIEGVCAGIDEQGALLIDTLEGVQRCLSGVVTRFEASS